MNKVILIGNLGADGELKMLQNGQAVLNFRVATTEKWKNAQGEKQEKTEWHRCALWGTRAEGLAQFMTKGTRVAVEGSISTREYEKDGERRFATDIKVFNVELLGGGKREEGEGGGERAPRAQTQRQQSAPPAAAGGDDFGDYSGGGSRDDDEIPF